MKNKIILLFFAFAISFGIYAQNEIRLTVRGPTTPEDKTLIIPLANDSNVEIGSTGEVMATTLMGDIGTGGFRDALINAVISTGNSIPEISFQCIDSFGATQSCNSIGTITGRVTVTISNDPVNCFDYFNNILREEKVGSATITTPYNFIPDSSGNYKVVCENNGGIKSYDEDIGLTDPPSVSISATPNSVPSGSPSTIMWSALGDPDNCTFTGAGWPSGTLTNTAITSSNFPISPFNIDSVTSSQTLGVECSYSTLSSPLSDSVTVNLQTSTGSEWTTCTDGSAAIKPTGFSEDRTILSTQLTNSTIYNGTYDQFQGVNDERPWPGILGETISLSLTKDKYIAAKFTTGSNVLSQLFQYGGTGNTQGPNTDNITSISLCPGDFFVHLGQTRCKQGGDLRWTTDQGASTDDYCILLPDTEYFLNIVQPNCSDTFCGILAQQTNSTL